MRCVSLSVSAISIQQNKTENIFYWRSFNMQIICENEQRAREREREKKIGYCNKCIMHGQSTVNTHKHYKHTRSLLCYVYLLFPSILSYFSVHFFSLLSSLMNTIYYSSCKLLWICKELLYVISHYRSFVCARACAICVVCLLACIQ